VTAGVLLAAVPLEVVVRGAVASPFVQAAVAGQAVVTGFVIRAVR
jgi:hypothetical protein